MVQVANGGTGLSTAAGAGQFLAGNGAGGYATRSLAAGDLPPNATFVNVATQTFVSTSAATLGQATVNGPLTVNGPTILNGQLSKPAGSFRIDHPLDPEHKYLYHSFVESPDMMNIYNGVVRLDARGRAWVTLPEWFEALNREFRYQLTAIGAPGPNLHIAEEITGNRFKIAGGRAGSKVSWQVTGIRHDKYANEHRIPVEEEKPSAEQ